MRNVPAIAAISLGIGLFVFGIANFLSPPTSGPLYFYEPPASWGSNEAVWGDMSRFLMAVGAGLTVAGVMARRL